MRQLARCHGRDPKTMRSLLKEDLGMESREIIQWLFLTPNAQELRKERCYRAVSLIKLGFFQLKILLGDVAINRCNSHYLKTSLWWM
jgi:hypothetical protein